MAPFGPLPDMVSKLISRSWFVARRNDSSRRTVSISSTAPDCAAPSSQARNLVTAAPSRSCAARAPLISAAFFTAFNCKHGSEPRAIRRGPPSARAKAKLAVCGSTRTRLLALRRVASRSLSASGGLSFAKLFSSARVLASSFSGAMKSSGLPAWGMRANASATGLCGMSEPRMLKAHATESLSVSNAASWRSSLSRFWMSAILSAAERPASLIG